MRNGVAAAGHGSKGVAFAFDRGSLMVDSSAAAQRTVDDGPPGRSISLTLGNRRLLVDDGGVGPAVVLLHGLAGFSGLWADALIALRTAGFRAIAYDHRGHGGSDDVSPPWGIGDLSGDLRAVLDALEIPKACIVGHSMGGRTMFRFALDEPQRTWALVAVGAQSEAPSGVYRRVLEELGQATLHHGLAGFRGVFESAGEIPERVHWDQGFADGFDVAFGRNRPTMLVAALDAILSMQRLTPRLPEIAVPMLAVVGDRDEHFTTLADHYSRVVADCRTVTIDDCHHYPMTDAATAFNEQLVAFVRHAAPDA